jgi:ATP-dependent DNA helicase RecG
MENVDLPLLLVTLLSQDSEAEWLEFKRNYADQQEIGEYISALSNSARLCGTGTAYMIWGIDDKSHQVVGTGFNPGVEKVGGQGLDLWLALKIRPQIEFRFHRFAYEGKHVVILTIKANAQMPVRFGDIEYIRVGSHKTRLRDYPEKEKLLWQIGDKHRVEYDIVAEKVDPDHVLALPDCPSYFQLLSEPLPSGREGILNRFVNEKLISRRADGLFDISILGALLFARDLSDFDRIARKAVRVISYKGKNRIETIRERVLQPGYATGFVRLIEYINEHLPVSEMLGQALRVNKRMYPEIAIRELVANSIIHQDLTIQGTSPMVEIFQDRIEITNPGTTLIHPLRLMDEPPRSRNEVMAALMRRFNICEERGSGIDKVVHEVELHQLPAPEIHVTDQHTKVTLFATKSLNAMSKADKVRACYQHACLSQLSSEVMTNSSLRKRFGISDPNYSIASRIIADTLAEELIRPHDPDSSSKKHAKYLPFWA